MARVTGLEPATSGVTGRHSNRLSYTRTKLLKTALRSGQQPSVQHRHERPAPFDERLTKGFARRCQAGLKDIMKSLVKIIPPPPPFRASARSGPEPVGSGKSPAQVAFRPPRVSACPVSRHWTIPETRRCNITRARARACARHAFPIRPPHEQNQHLAPAPSSSSLFADGSYLPLTGSKVPPIPFPVPATRSRQNPGNCAGPQPGPKLFQKTFKITLAVFLRSA